MSNVVPEGWAEFTQGDIANFSNGRAYKLTEWEKAGTPVIRLQNLTGSGKDFYYSNLQLPKRQYCHDGDLLYMWSATFGPHIWKGPKAIYHYHIWKITCNEIDVTKSYLYQLLEFKTEEWLNKSNGMGILHITKGGMEELKLVLPPLPEQKKIAAILTSVDDVIEKTQAQIDKLKDLKTGMMQELLTRGVGVDGKPHTEFKDSPVGRIPKGWEVSSLGELISVMESGWSPQCHSEQAMLGEWCILKTTAIQWHGFDYLANKKLPSSLVPRAEIQVKKEDVLVTRAGPADRVGVVSYVESVPSKVMLSDKIIRIRTLNNCRSDFLSLWLSGEFSQRFMASRVSGLATSQTNISQSILRSVPCVVPSLEEQAIISNTIFSINRKIERTQKKFTAQLSLKKALMQDLLTGKVRVKVED
ncbi:restriction endonuclease subunit S [Vibrio alginolyticus]|nr:restriction endonuclease subunit S [Vibrio alginolyticus]